MHQLTQKQSQWLKHIHAAHKSGLSYSAYAKQQGINANALYNQKSKLIALGVLEDIVADGTRAACEPVKSFVPATVVSEESYHSLPVQQTLHIRFPNGSALSIPMQSGIAQQLVQWLSNP